MNAAAETISITNRAGIFFLLVCCAAVSFMIWFLTSLTREGHSRQQGRLRLLVKATALESVEALEDTLPAFGAASVRAPMTLPPTNVVDKRAIEIATASRRTRWGRRIPSW